MLQSFYYEDDGQTIRVEAESWEQTTQEPELGQCPTLYHIDGTGSYHASFRNRRVTVEFSSVITEGPITNPTVTQEGRYVRWYIDGFDRYTGEPRTYRFYSVRENIGSATAGAFETLTYERLDGEDDDCGAGGGCITEFYRAGQVIHSIDFCPPITQEEPECCCECCDELAAIARTIRV